MISSLFEELRHIWYVLGIIVGTTLWFGRLEWTGRLNSKRITELEKNKELEALHREQDKEFVYNQFKEIRKELYDNTRYLEGVIREILKDHKG